MTNANDANFESKKNMQAGTITLVILAVLFLFLFLVGWTTPTVLQPVPDEGIEVNLGNSDAGLGNDQPFLPGKSAPQDQQQYTPPKQEQTQKEDVKDPATDDKDPDAPEIKKPPVTKPDATKIADKDEPKKITPKKVEAVAPPAPAPPKPKAVFKGINGTGTGGNEADSYKKGGSEGIAGGKGDQGKPGGNPDSKNYEGGGHGNGSFQIIRGDRHITSGTFSFTGDFDENATVYADIKVAPDGSGQFVRVTKPTTNYNRQYTDMITQKLKNVRFNTAADESMVNIQFNFKIRN
jgi:hypothetical protein